MQAVDRFDTWVDRGFDHLRGRPRIDRAYYAATELGDFGLIWLLLGSVTALRQPDPLRAFGRIAVLMGIESAIVNGGIKSVFRRTRPVHEGERPHRMRQPRTSSFPSGHASSAFLAAAILSEGTHLGPAYYALAVVVATSRIHVKIHHGSDVVAGMALGAAMGATARRFWPRPGAAPSAPEGHR